MTTTTADTDIGPNWRWREPAWWAWDLLAMALASLDLSLHLLRHWVAFDDGQLGLSGSLVRQGMWPHRDYNEVYSGGLALLDAGAQWLFGDDLVAIRIPLAIATILWVPLLCACFRRFIPPAAAAGFALLGYLWGPSLFSVAMPTWYLLYLATGAAWCLLKWNETEDARWWGAAGLCIGLALFIKINALFLLAGAGCVLLTDERHRSGIIGWTLVLLGVLGAVMTVGSGWWWPYAARLVVPLALLAIVAIAHAVRVQRGNPAGPRAVISAGAWLALGVGVIVVPWFLVYALNDGLPRLIEGLFVLPFKRPENAAFLPQAFKATDLLPLGALPVLLWIRWPRIWGWLAAILIVALAFYLVDAAGIRAGLTVKFGWRLVRGWGILALVAVAAARWWEKGPAARPVVIVGWIAAWCALWQYPFAGANYMAYVAPLLLLAAVAAASLRPAREVGLGIAAALTLWTVAINHGQPLNLLGYTRATPPPPLAPLDVPHGGGLLVPAEHAVLMRSVVDILQGWQVRSIVAAPDIPHIYYFMDMPMPGREMYEFFSPNWSATALAEVIRTKDPDAVVLARFAPFSPIPVDSVPILLGRPILADTSIGPYRILLYRRVGG